MITPKDSLLAASQTGEFLNVICHCAQAAPEAQDELVSALVALHNEALVDVVAEFARLTKRYSADTDFFLARHVFEKAIPYLNASVGDLMRCVLKLYRAAGLNMAAGTIFGSYIAFCAKTPARPLDALREIETKPAELLDMLPATIAAASRMGNPRYLQEVIRLSQHPNLTLRQCALYSMHRVQWPKAVFAEFVSVY